MRVWFRSYAVQCNSSHLEYTLPFGHIRSIIYQIFNKMERVGDVDAEAVPDLLALNEAVQIGRGEINASGHRQELQRNFDLLALCGVAITTGNSWVAIGGTIVRLSLFNARRFVVAHKVQAVALYNGGPPGLIYGLWVL